MVCISESETIELRFITSNSLISWMIRSLTKSEYSHVEVVVEQGYLGSQYPEGVRLRPLDYTKPHKECRVVVRVTPNDKIKVLEWLQQQLGKPYDLTALIGILANNRDWKEDDSWFCSELIAAAFVSIGMELIRDDVSRVTPGDLFKSPLLLKKEA